MKKKMMKKKKKKKNRFACGCIARPAVGRGRRLVGRNGMEAGEFYSAYLIVKAVFLGKKLYIS